MARGNIYTEDQIAQAKAMLATGSTVSDVVRLTGVPKQTVSRWRTELNRHAKDIRVTELMLDHLKTATTAIAAIELACSDPEWIAQQRGQDRAMLLKVLNEKMFRILTAMETEDTTTDTFVTEDGSVHELGNDD